MDTNDDELSFELLAGANQRVLNRLLGEPRERLDVANILKGFDQMTDKAANTTDDRLENRSGKLRRSR